MDYMSRSAHSIFIAAHENIWCYGHIDIQNGDEFCGIWSHSVLSDFPVFCVFLFSTFSTVFVDQHLRGMFIIHVPRYVGSLRAGI